MENSIPKDKLETLLSDFSLKDIGKQYGVSYVSIGNLARRYGLARPKEKIIQSQEYLDDLERISNLELPVDSQSDMPLASRSGRTVEEYDRAMSLLKDNGITGTAKIMGLSYSTVNNWKRGRKPIPYSNLAVDNNHDYINRHIGKEAYSYILGCYLGDGWLCADKHNDIRYIKVACHLDQTEIQNAIGLAMCLFSSGYTLRKRASTNCIDVSTNTRKIIKLLPHHGVGKKNLRKISLKPWQLKAIDWRFLAIGLFHSDGSYYKSHNYSPNGIYEFINTSEDISAIYIHCLKMLGINYTIRLRHSKSANSKLVIVIRADLEESRKLLPILGEKNKLPEYFTEAINGKLNKVLEKYELAEAFKDEKATRFKLIPRKIKI